MTPDGLRVGLAREDSQEVTVERTASHVGSGSLRVYATPAMALFLERTCMALVQPHLPEGRTTVGEALRLRHLAPTPLGGRVHLRAELVGIEGPRLQFEARLWDGEGPVGEGEHTRHVVDTARFLDRIRARAEKLGTPGSSAGEAGV